MGFAILWLAGLASGVLLVALALAQGVRMREGRLATGLPFIAALVPFGIGAVASVVAEQLHSQGLRPSYLAYALLWTTAFVIAAICVIHFGSHRASESAPMPATRWPRGIIAGALGASIAIYIGTLLYMDARVRRDLEEVKAEAIRMAESVAPKPVPDERNAALVYERAFEAMGELAKGRPQWRDLYSTAEDRTSDVATEEVAEFLREHVEALALLRKAAFMPDYSFKTQYVPPRPDMQSPDGSSVFRAARLLALSARHQASKGNMREALDDIAASWRMVRHFAETPTLLTCMRALHQDYLGSGSLQDVLASGPVREADLGDLPLEPDISFIEARVKAGKMEDAIALHVAAEPWSHRAHGHEYSTAQGMLWRVFVAEGALAWYRSRIRLARRLTPKPYHETWGQCAGLDAEVRTEGTRGLRLFGFSLGNLKSGSAAIADALARRRLAVLGVAAARFRTEKGRYPEEPAELVPDCISAVPVDPFDGKPLKMAPEGDGLVLYSVGWDGKDDVGNDTSWSIGQSGCPDGEDISFRLGDAYTSAVAKARNPRRKRHPKKKRKR